MGVRPALRRERRIWYNNRMKLPLSILTAFLALALAAERQPVERYQSIIDRQMFGVPPAGFDPAKPASEVSRSAAVEESAQQAQIRSAIRFSAINVTPSGETAVGFTDSSDAKNPVHYYLKVGESRNGWLVKDADPAKATMTIAKGEVEVSLSIGGDSSKSPGPSGASGADRAPVRRPSGLIARNGGANSPVGSSNLGSLRGRRLLREQKRQAEAAEAAAEKAAEAQRREEERRRAEEEKAQREAEREEQRAQLLQIQEELRKAREARAARDAEAAAALDADGE